MEIECISCSDCVENASIKNGWRCRKTDHIFDCKTKPERNCLPTWCPRLAPQIIECLSCSDCVENEFIRGGWRCRKAERIFDCKTKPGRNCLPTWCPRLEKNRCNIENELQNRIDELEAELAEAKSPLFDLEHGSF